MCISFLWVETFLPGRSREAHETWEVNRRQSHGKWDLERVSEPLPSPPPALQVESTATAEGSSNQLRHRSEIPGSGATCKPCKEFRVAAFWVITCAEVSFLVMPLLLSHPWSCKQPWTHTPGNKPNKNSLAQSVGLPCNHYIGLSLILFLELIGTSMCTVSPQKKSLTQMKSIALRRRL